LIGFEFVDTTGICGDITQIPRESSRSEALKKNTVGNFSKHI
jgi:hypothetical protein